jgi:hypothetical protein
MKGLRGGAVSRLHGACSPRHVGPLRMLGWGRIRCYLHLVTWSMDKDSPQ